MQNSISNALIFIPDICTPQINEYRNIFKKSLGIPEHLLKKVSVEISMDSETEDYGVMSIIYGGLVINQIYVADYDSVPITFKDFIKINEQSEKMFREEWFYGVKDENAVKSMVNQVYADYFGKQICETILEKAVYYWYNIATKQMFHNGNKRTALLTALTFLNSNGYGLDKVDKNELYDISLDLATHKMTEEDLLNYLLKHVRINIEWSKKVVESLKK